MMLYTFCMPGMKWQQREGQWRHGVTNHPNIIDLMLDSEARWKEAIKLFINKVLRTKQIEGRHRPSDEKGKVNKWKEENVLKTELVSRFGASTNGSWAVGICRMSMDEEGQVGVVNLVLLQQ